MSAISVKLVNVIRRRRSLTLPETCVIIESVARQLDEIPTEIFLPQLLPMVSLQFAREADDGSGLLSKNLMEWPSYEVKLEMEFAPALTSHAMTLIPGSSGSKLNSLATFIYEVLGGSRRDSRGTVKYSPLSSLDEEANMLLRAAFQGEIHESCVEFSNQWFEAMERKDDSATAPLQAEPSSIADASFQILLELRPIDSAISPIRFSARRQFRIGRSSRETDFPIMADSSPANSKFQLDEISRVQVMMDHIGSGVLLFDGDGHKASRNGSLYEGKALNPDQPTFVRRPGLLSMGGYELRIVPVFESAKQTARLKSLFVMSVEQRQVVRHAGWVFSEIMFRLDQSGRFNWEEKSQDSVTILYENGKFFIRAGSNRQALSFNGAKIPADRLTPLTADGILRIGRHDFKSAIEIQE